MMSSSRPRCARKPVHGPADLAGVFGHEEDRVAGLRAGRRRQLRPLVVGQKLRNRALWPAPPARDTRRRPDPSDCPASTVLSKKLRDLLGRAGRNNGAHHVARGHRLREHREPGLAEDLGHVDGANRIAQVRLVAAVGGHRLVDTECAETAARVTFQSENSENSPDSTGSIAANTSSCSTNDISRSSW